jgi:RNA polymerase sigma factor (sigma-70 family)
MVLDDSTLWARSRAGDHGAFGQLFERHARAIYNYCFRRLGDWGAAEDALSIVFLEAWRRREKELPDGAVLPWLYGIATNVVRNRRRSERRYAAALARVPKSENEPDHSDSAAERIDRDRSSYGLVKLVSRLPKREQDAFVLCAWSELSYAEAAFALGVPVGTIRSRLSRARARLRELGEASGHNQDETANAQEADYDR